MSGTLGPGSRRTQADASSGTHDADPWWETATSDASGVARTRSTTPVRSAPASRRGGTGWFVLGLALAPFAWMAARIRRSPRMRQLVLRVVILGIVLTFLACSVGVILVNNVVIGRTAELGTLDDRRRELRRDNAVLGEEVAKLSAPPLVQSAASRRLGMVRATVLPKFIFLDGSNRTLTPFQRHRYQLRLRRLQAAKARRAATADGAPAATPVTKDTP